MPKPRKYALERWPAPDRAAWEAATSTAVGFFARGPFAGCALETKRQMFYAYSRWLAFLSKRDPAAQDTAPQARLTRARLEGFIEWLAQGTKGQPVMPQTMVSTINHFCNAVHAVAPDYDRAWLRQAQGRFSKQIKPRNKRDRMEPAAALSALGFKLMDQAAAIADARAAARTFRDGLLIAVVMSSTLRRKNLTALAVGKNLYRVGAHYQIVIAGKDMKSRRRIDQSLPDELTPYIEDYRNGYRPRFAGANRHNGLWPSTKGGVMCAEAIWDAVRRRTRAEFGHPINLHLVRDIAATSAPDLGSHLLGHTKPTLTDQYYRRGDSLAASRKLAGVIADLRAKAPRTQSIARVRAATEVPAPQPPACIPSEEVIT